MLQPRATKYIDVLVDTTPANATRVRAAIVEFFGSEPPNITEEKLMNPRTLIVLGAPPQRIDILTRIDGITSSSAIWRRRVTARYGGTTAHFIALTDLVRAKRAAGRPQDVADVHALELAAARTNSASTSRPSNTRRRSTP